MTRDMTYKDKCNNGEWRLVDYVQLNVGIYPGLTNPGHSGGLDSSIHRQTII